MKTQEVLNYMRDEWGQAWRALDDRWHQFRQRSNHALVVFKPTEQQADSEGNDKSAEWGFLPAEMFDLDNKLVVRVEIPGLNSDALEVRVDGNDLVISGEKQLTPSAPVDSGKCFFSEISYGSFERRVALPKRRVAEDSNEANYNQGVLTVEMPFIEEAETSARTISVH